jgi:hypothetical protein
MSLFQQIPNAGAADTTRRRMPNRGSKRCLLLVFLLATLVMSHAQSATEHPKPEAASPTRITIWEDGVSGAILFLHQLFPDINPKSKSIVQNDRDWRSSPGGIGSFRINICEPDVSNPRRNEEEARDFFAHADVQCSVLTIQAGFLMTGSQLGPVPASIGIWRPEIEKRRTALAALLVAHPSWSEEQAEEAMKAAGVRYGKDAHNDVAALLRDAWPKLEIFFGKLKLDSMEYFPTLLTEPKLPVGPSWIIKAHPSEQDPAKYGNSYTLTFSSFDGAFEGEMIGPVAASSGKH